MLTHGHEDHIGAVPYLLQLKGDIPLIGSTLTLALVEAKLKEHRIRPVTDGRQGGPARRLGVFDLEFVAVNHSIPDALAVFVRTEAGTCCTPATSRWTSCRSTAASPTCAASPAWARRGSTSSSPTRRTPTCRASPTPELEIAPAIDKVFRHAERRIIVACFSSHVHRVQQVLDAAEKAGRKVAWSAGP